MAGSRSVLSARIRIELMGEFVEAIKCTDDRCQKWFKMPSDEDQVEVGCDDCGSHPAARCPHCEEDVDLVFNEPELMDEETLPPVALTAD
jgi:hypothetical protein